MMLKKFFPLTALLLALIVSVSPVMLPAAPASAGVWDAVVERAASWLAGKALDTLHDYMKTNTPEILRLKPLKAPQTLSMPLG